VYQPFVSRAVDLPHFAEFSQDKSRTNFNASAVDDSRVFDGQFRVIHNNVL
jgi:hypothetical protein